MSTGRKTDVDAAYAVALLIAAYNSSDLSLPAGWQGANWVVLKRRTKNEISDSLCLVVT